MKEIEESNDPEIEEWEIPYLLLEALNIALENPHNKELLDKEAKAPFHDVSRRLLE